MTIAVVQTALGSAAGNGTDIATANFAASVTAGNLLYVCVVDITAVTHNTPTDTPMRW